MERSIQMKHETDQGHLLMRRSGILRGLLLCCLLAWLAFLPTVSFAQTVSFGAATPFSVGSFPESVAVGDFNGDGRLDLAVANTGSNTVSILLRTGAGAFGAATDFSVGSLPFSVAVGDFNGDGRLDLAVANLSSNTVYILLGTGRGSFGAATHFSAGASHTDAVAG